MAASGTPRAALPSSPRRLHVKAAGDAPARGSLLARDKSLEPSAQEPPNPALTQAVYSPRPERPTNRRSLNFAIWFFMTAELLRSSAQKFSSLPARTVTTVPSPISPRAITLKATGSVLLERQWGGRMVHTKFGLPVRTSSPGCSPSSSVRARSDHQQSPMSSPRCMMPFHRPYLSRTASSPRGAPCLPGALPGLPGITQLSLCCREPRESLPGARGTAARLTQQRPSSGTATRARGTGHNPHKHSLLTGAPPHTPALGGGPARAPRRVSLPRALVAAALHGD
ncbi:hypothetical protein E2C01_068846 [Portunus trituberculatus]|uniref:Uncharacterized protein n=1 Tax=Portunus trituberculatus TaxID=210409 RepID=A0A5B7HXB4_PORTR|nr:hypothetical protein [Portunus trituberculatus]